jgi:hypothetical protein
LHRFALGLSVPEKEIPCQHFRLMANLAHRGRICTLGNPVCHSSVPPKIGNQPVSFVLSLLSILLLLQYSYFEIVVIRMN